MQRRDSRHPLLSSPPCPTFAGCPRTASTWTSESYPRNQHSSPHCYRPSNWTSSCRSNRESTRQSWNNPATSPQNRGSRLGERCCCPGGCSDHCSLRYSLRCPADRSTRRPSFPTISKSWTSLRSRTVQTPRGCCRGGAKIGAMGGLVAGWASRVAERAFHTRNKGGVTAAEELRDCRTLGRDEGVDGAHRHRRRSFLPR
mmetsp:Transcript_25893/g.46917  ORF Transcript_25893/g.46917 Transcript_25893/m.46917 type:complete len:200 (+) Transcript_25893:386-985(+)